MSNVRVSFELPEEMIAALDEVASNREVDRAEILLEALEMFVANYEELKADLEESARQIEAGQFVAHEDVVAWFNAQHSGIDKSEAA
jgi:predicted transcriptional regulator